jgi:capsular exopolysaccharide synthesis family protein
MNDGQFSIRDLIGILRRQFRLILVATAAILLAATAVVFVIPPVYTGTAVVLVDTANKDLLQTDSANSDSPIDSPRVDSEVELVRTDATLLQVIKEASLLGRPEFQAHPNLVDQLLVALRLKSSVEPTDDERLQFALLKLSEAIGVQRRGLTYLINVQARSGDPVTAAYVANALADTYIRVQLESKINATLAARNIIQSRISDANQQVVATEGALDGFIDENIDKIAALTGRTDLVELRRSLLATAGTAGDLAKQIAAASERLGANDYADLASALQDTTFSKLEADRERIRASLNQNNDMGLSAQLAKVEEQLQARAKAAIGGLQAKLTDAKASATDLRGQLRAAVVSADLPAETLASIYEVEQNAEIARTQYQALLARAKQLDSQAYLQVADSRVVSAALPPTTPSFPNSRLVVALAGIVGLIVSVGGAVLFESLVGGVTSVEQLALVTKLPVAAVIPTLETRRGRSGLADALVDAPLSIYSEAVRRLRIGTDLSANRALGNAEGSPRHRVIMVTSASSGEGKTTTSLALARAFALSGSTTLLIDCDLRRPSVHKNVGVEPSSGLLEYLSGSLGRSLRDIVVPDKTTGVQIITGATQSEFATDQFIMGAAFEQLITKAREAFDVVILDTPPIGPVVDGIYLARYVDVIAFLVRWGKTPQRDVRRALESLVEAKPVSTEIVSVLTQVSQRGNSYSYRYRGYAQDS